MDPTQASTWIDKYGWQGGFALLFFAALVYGVRYVLIDCKERETRLLGLSEKSAEAVIIASTKHAEVVKQVTADCHEHQLAMQDKIEENHRKALTLVLSRGTLIKAPDLAAGE